MNQVTHVTNTAKFINIANEINKLFGEHYINDRISMPRIVVVGAQSTGKSSLLNRIMNVDILPMGKSMITKTPIHINMHKSNQYMVEIGYYNGDKWTSTHKMIFEEFTEIQTEIIRSRIQSLSDKFTDNKSIVVNKPIVINLYSPDVTELSLIDLPGLITLACTDKGQSNTIVDDIQNLVKHYIKQPKTIVLTLIQAKQDLETDLGLAIVKNTIKECKDIHTVGVLTKPDLIDRETHMGDFLLGKMSRSLHMDYGYYIVNCKDNEKNYFSNHKVYNKQEYKMRCGIDNLTAGISEILISSIKRTLPNVIIELNKLESETTTKLFTLGTHYLIDDVQKLNYIGMTVKDFCDNLNMCIESKGAEPNIGHIIDHTFNKFRKTIQNTEIFDVNHLSNETIRQVYNNFRGYHIKIKTTPLEIIENIILQDNKPFVVLKNHCTNILDTLIQELLSGVLEILNKRHIQFSKFNNRIYTNIELFINSHKIKVQEMINNILDAEESYIWTEDPKFIEMLDSFDTVHKASNDFNIFESHHEYESYETRIRKLLNVYLDTIKKMLKCQIPKILAGMIIKELKNNLHNYLITDLNKKESCALLEYDPEYKLELDKLNKILNAIKTARTVISV